LTLGGAITGAQLGGGDGGAASAGVAVVAAVGAGHGLLAASSSNKHNHAPVVDTIANATTTFELKLQENDIDTVLSLNNSSMLDKIEAGIILDRNDVAKPTSALDEAVWKKSKMWQVHRDDESFFSFSSIRPK
jgi:hypothetical protein